MTYRVKTPSYCLNDNCGPRYNWLSKRSTLSSQPRVAQRCVGHVPEWALSQHTPKRNNTKRAQVIAVGLYMIMKIQLKVIKGWVVVEKSRDKCLCDLLPALCYICGKCMHGPTPKGTKTRELLSRFTGKLRFKQCIALYKGEKYIAPTMRDRRTTTTTRIE